MIAGRSLLTFLFIGVVAVNSERLLGAEKCTWGPAYWCGDISSAKECGAVNHCMTTSWKYDATAEVDSDGCCVECESVVNKLRNYAVLTERDTVLLLNSACDAIPNGDLAQQCKDGVKKYVKEIMDMAIQKIDAKKICTLIRLCKKTQDPQRRQPAAVRMDLHRVQLEQPQADTEVCEMCKLASMEAKTYLSNTDNQKKIVAMVKSEGCSRCPAKDKCEGLIDEYAPILFQILIQELDGQICNQVGLCGSKTHLLTPVFKQLLDVVSHLQYATDTSACDVCKNAFAKLKKYLADPQMRAAIRKNLDGSMCALCPSKDKCKADIDKYIDRVFAAIDNFLAKGDDICKKIGLCSGQPMTVQKMEVAEPKKLLGAECVICEFVLRQLDDLLKENKTEKAIIDALNKVCSLLPSTVTTECDDFVNQYAQMIIQLLVQELAPAQVCTALGLCNGEKAPEPQLDTALRFSPLLLRGAPIVHKVKPAPAAVKPKVAPEKAKMPQNGASPQCILCEFLMSKLDSLLSENATEQDIIHALDKVCSIMPKSVSAECQQMVDEYAPAIIKILTQELRPGIVCTFLGLCPISKDHPLPTGAEACETCETVMLYVDSLLKENATQLEIEHLLLKVCNFLPEVVRGECNMFVFVYKDEIMSFLINHLKPKEICSELKLCAKKQQHISNVVPMLKLKAAHQSAKARNLIGKDASKCMYGPSYWCASRYNAKKCKMTAHCQEHYWSKKITLN